jgi:hypothetical protein
VDYSNTWQNWLKNKAYQKDTSQPEGKRQEPFALLKLQDSFFIA